MNNIPESDRTKIECAYKLRDGSKCRKLGIFEHNRESINQLPILFCSTHSNLMCSVFPEREQVEYPELVKDGSTVKRPIQQPDINFSFDDLME